MNNKCKTLRSPPLHYIILDSIVVSIPACHAGDRGSIPRRGDVLLSCMIQILIKKDEAKFLFVKVKGLTSTVKLSSIVV